MVNGERLFDRLRLRHLAPALGSVECRLDQCRDSAESDVPVQEFVHSYFIGGIQYRWRPAARGKRTARRRQPRETYHIGFLESQGRYLRQIEAGGGGFHAD